MFEWLPILFALISTGIIAGLLAGLLGVGGGIVIVPVLYFIFQFLKINPHSAMLIATGTSLATIIPTSMASMRAHWRRKNIERQLVQRWFPFIVIGVVSGVSLATSLGGRVASTVFGVVAILVSLNMLLRARSTPILKELPGRIWQSLAAFCIGLISSIMGIGGGTLGVPFLTAFNLDVHRAVGTAAVFGFIIAVPGAVLMLLFGETPADAPLGTYGLVNVIGFAIIVPLTVMMAPVGVKLGSYLNGAILKRVFAVFLCLSGMRMLYQLLQ